MRSWNRLTVTDNTTLDEYLERCSSRVEHALELWLPQPGVQPGRLHEAMRYAALGSGKRVRPFLVYATGDALGTPPDRLDGAACAVELIHA
jgi:farnesyl diphosphate synthase